MKTAIPLKQVIAGFSPLRKKQIKARAGELIAEEMAQRDIRKSRALTQEQVAKRLGGKQIYVSRLESRSDVKVSTLRDYVHALGGELQLMVTFPEGAKASIKGASLPHSPISLPSTKSTESRPR
jgi:Helix-turn-helix domain